MIALRLHVANVKATYIPLLLQRYSSATSTPPAAPIPPKASPVIADYLIKSLGFSEEEAISASAKVSHFKSTQNPDLVINLFKQYGLDQSQIRTIISKAPIFLTYRVDETLDSKFRAFKELGLSGSDLVGLIQKNTITSDLFKRRLNTHIIPTISYLRNVLGSDENVVKAIKRSSWILAPHALKYMPENVILLQNYGLSNERIQKFILTNSSKLLLTPKRFEDVLSRVERELGIPRDSPMFLYGVHVLASCSKSYIQVKIGTFRSFGFSDLEFYAMVKVQPMVLSLSEARICSKLNFYLNELGYAPEYIASRPILLMVSLEKRVKPRNQVFNILKENKLVNCQLYSVLLMTELKFTERFVLPYKEEIPDLFETYTKSVASK